MAANEFHNPTEALIMALSKPTTKAQKRINARMALKKCLAILIVQEKQLDANGNPVIVETQVDCDGDIEKLGLCKKCARRFFGAMERMTPYQAEIYRKEREREGVVLKRQEQRGFTTGNYFKRLAR